MPIFSAQIYLFISCTYMSESMEMVKSVDACALYHSSSESTSIFGFFMSSIALLASLANNTTSYVGQLFWLIHVWCSLCLLINNFPTSFNGNYLWIFLDLLFFRLVTDRETGKPKGYGFCEYKDEETALSARRNLQGYEINGRQLRVDFAENDKGSDKNREQVKYCIKLHHPFVNFPNCPLTWLYPLASFCFYIVSSKD